MSNFFGNGNRSRPKPKSPAISGRRQNLGKTYSLGREGESGTSGRKGCGNCTSTTELEGEGLITWGEFGPDWLGRRGKFDRAISNCKRKKRTYGSRILTEGREFDGGE